MHKRLYQLLDKRYPGAAKQHYQAKERYANGLHGQGYGEGSFEGVSIYRHALPGKPPVPYVTRNRGRLYAAALLGYQSVLDIFEPDAVATLVPSKI